MTNTVRSSSQGPSVAPIYDRLSWLWLVLGFGVLIFANGLHTISAAAWLGPLLVVRFIRTQKAWVGLLVGYIASAVAFYIGWQPAFVDAGKMFTVYSVAFALVCFLPYVLDRLVQRKIGGFAGTLVLPVAWVTVEYLLHLVSPLGTFFLLPYTQYDNLPLLQIMSVMGMWSITFLVGWFASTMNYAWENDFEIRKVGRGVAVYALILVAVLGYGGARLAFYPNQAQTVKVAAITTNVNKEVIPEPDSEMDVRLLAGALTAADRVALTATMTEINQDLLERTRTQARAGAKIITWTEYNAHIWKDEETTFLNQARQLAKEEGIYLVFPLATIETNIAKRQEPQLVVENKSVMITPQGEIAYQYVKHNLLIGWESEHAVRGERQIEVIDTPYGKLSSVICLDMEYPDFMRLAGQQGVDIMLSGAIDGTPSSQGNPLHAIMASYRTIEEGFSLARGGFYGQNEAVDYQGRTVARANHYNGDDRTVVAQLPIEGAHTIYSQIGDVFPWACISGYALFVIVAIARAIKSKKTA